MTWTTLANVVWLTLTLVTLVTILATFAAA